jgi:hypothetical protein
VVNNAKSSKERSGAVPLLIIAAVVAVLGGALWWFLLRGSGGPAQPPPLTAEAKAYVRNLGLSEVEMKAKENFMGSMLMEITGKITNKGDRKLKVVELNCVFYDPYGQVVLRERVPIVRSKGGAPLEPGETRAFRMPFDAIPASWNQALPQLVIAHIDFGD